MAKTVLITGGATGIGKETSILFAKRGYNVIIAYNTSENDAIKLEKELVGSGLNARAIRADITKTEEVERLFDEIHKHYKSVDIVVNNAGICHSSLIQDTLEEDYDRIFNVNMKSVYMVNNFALKDMIFNKFGRIINVSSMWGERGASCEVVYSASKSAVIGYTKALAKEVGLSGITVNAVLPGVIDTKMNARLSKEDLLELIDATSVGRIGTPFDVANAILFLASDESSFITGQSLGVDGGFIG